MTTIDYAPAKQLGLEESNIAKIITSNRVPATAETTSPVEQA